MKIQKTPLLEMFSEINDISEPSPTHLQNLVPESHLTLEPSNPMVTPKSHQKTVTRNYLELCWLGQGHSSLLSSHPDSVSHLDSEVLG